MSRNVILAVVILFSTGAWAANPETEAVSLSYESAAALQRLMANPNSAPSSEIISYAACVATIPKFEVGGVILFGGAGGRGLVTCRNSDGHFGAPVFFQLASGGFGPQFGYYSGSLILIFTTPDGRNAFIDERMMGNASGSFAIGPIASGKAEAGTESHLTSGIRSYSTGGGLYVGGSLDGRKISIVTEYNEVFYQSAATAQILASPQIPEVAQIYVNVVEKYLNPNARRRTPVAARGQDQIQIEAAPRGAIVPAPIQTQDLPAPTGVSAQQGPIDLRQVPGAPARRP